MINLIEEANFWEFCAEKNTYIHHQPGERGKLRRFARYNDERIIGDISNLGHIRLEMRDTPYGNFPYNGSGLISDVMVRELRVVSKFKANDFSDKLLQQNICKQALLEIVRYIHQQQEGPGDCPPLVLRMDIGDVDYQLLDTVIDGTFTGCLIRIKLKAPVTNDAVNYGTFVF